MSLTTLLSVAIALSFAYFLLSTVASAINEAIGAVFKRRPNGLKQAILALVGGEQPGEKLDAIAQRVYGHSLISGLSTIVRPSYVPSRNFTHAVIDVLVKDGGGSVMSSLHQAIADLPPEHPLTQALRSAATEAQGDIEAFKKLLDKWFDDAMDRLSGAYKRWSQVFLFAIGLCLAFAFNADTIHMVSALMADKPALANVVEVATHAAETITSAEPKPGGSAEPGASNDQSGAGAANGAARAPEPATSQGAATPAGADAAKPADTAKDADARTLEQDIADSKRNILDATDRLLNVGLPIGWPACPSKTEGIGVTCWNAGDRLPTVHGWGGTLLGWLLTAIAISFGGPFWFDLLNTFVNIRATGPKPKATNKGDPAATS